ASRPRPDVLPDRPEGQVPGQGYVEDLARHAGVVAELAAGVPGGALDQPEVVVIGHRQDIRVDDGDALDLVGHPRHGVEVDHQVLGQRRDAGALQVPVGVEALEV